MSSSECSTHAQALAEELEHFTNASALMIAHERALETEKDAAALVVDPFASLLAGTKGGELSAQFGASCHYFGFQDWPEFHQQWTVVRTKFIDDTLTQATDVEAPLRPSQFVNLGAGLDTRVFRLSCMTCFRAAYEVDMQEMNTPKARILGELGSLGAKENCPQSLVSADLAAEGALSHGLEEAGFDPEQKSVFLAEGLIMYLPKESQLSLLREVSALAADGSKLILNFLEAEGQPHLPREQIVETLEAEGWTAIKVHQYGDDILNYGRFRADFPPSKAFQFVVCNKGA